MDFLRYEKRDLFTNHNRALSIGKVKFTLVFSHKTVGSFEMDAFRFLVSLLHYTRISKINLGRILVPMPRRRKYFFFPRSPHVNKKSMASYYFVNPKILFDINITFPNGESRAENLGFILHKLLLLNLLNYFKKLNFFIRLKVKYSGISYL